MWTNKNVVDLRRLGATEPHATTFDTAFGSLRIQVRYRSHQAINAQAPRIATGIAGDLCGQSTFRTSRVHRPRLPARRPNPFRPCPMGCGPHYNHDSVLGNDPIDINPKQRHGSIWYPMPTPPLQTSRCHSYRTQRMPLENSPILGTCRRRVHENDEPGGGALVCGKPASPEGIFSESSSNW